MTRIIDNNIREELIDRGFNLDGNTGEIIGFNANHFAEFIGAKYKVIYTNEGFFYAYQKGNWFKRDDNRVLTKLRETLQKPYFGTWTLKREKEYVEALKRTVYYEGGMNPYREYVNLLNGMYDLETFQLVEHNPDFYSTIQIPIAYDPTAQCPQFMIFLDQVFQSDEQRKRLAQEWLGYLISSETKAQKALLLIGGGANGKGVFVSIISSLIGEENISNIPLNELNKGFSRVCLYHKTANISSENEMEAKGFNTQYFKGIVGEDPITAEQKNKPVFTFKPTVKLVMAMNNLPYTADKSEGFYRRLSMLHFSAFFSEEERDRDLKEKLQAELPGIFIWALEGLKRLREKNYNFSECDSARMLLYQYKKELNPILQFCEECIIPTKDKSYREDNRAIYTAYKNWAVSNGQKNNSNISNQKFWKEFDNCTRQLGYKCDKGKSNDIRYRTGIKVVGEYKMLNGFLSNNHSNIQNEDEPFEEIGV